MRKIFEEVKKKLPELLEKDWESLYIDYHPPIVERLWRQYGDYRIYLHRIHFCKEGEALFHLHPWPSAVLVVSGMYEMYFGYDDGKVTIPSCSGKILIDVDKHPLYYEMINPIGKHSVRPTMRDVSYSLMITGKPTGVEAPKSEKPLRNLGFGEEQRILDFFKSPFAKGQLDKEPIVLCM